ncbi:MAG: hypothetical protein HWE07_02485 [Cytophagia bacterium]|nr:hypothetical protein [Cytophagia bacterium]
MTTHKNIDLKNEIFFITFTCHEWIPLFHITNLYDYFEKWFKHLKTLHADLLGYVIMPNHFHALLFVHNDCSKTINSLISNGKRFLAYEIVKRLKATENLKTLQRLQNGVAENELKKKKLHQVFKPSFDLKICFNRRMVETKLDYIHRNPSSLIDDYTQYPYSSVGFYFREEESTCLKDYKEFI